jgi:putative ubiquitin-RnfH superfamily antitoxin RatB of RatAB toxin-antitoxin module
MIRVEVVFALPLEQDVTVVECEPGATVREVIERSGVLTRQPGVALSRIGIWGRRSSPEELVRDGDRVELYRPLTADPKEVRRRRAARTRG